MAKNKVFSRYMRPYYFGTGLFSLIILGTGAFAISNTKTKYKSTTEYAIQSLNKLFGSFKVLVDFWGINKFLFNSYLIYFKAISREDWKKKPSKWYRDPDIRKMYGYIWDSLPFKDKVKYKVVQMLSVFYR